MLLESPLIGSDSLLSIKEGGWVTLPAAVSALNLEHSERGTAGFTPTRVIELELTEPLPRLDNDGHYGRAWILVRLRTEPIGVCVIELSRDGVAADALADIVWRELKQVIAERFAGAGLAAPTGLSGAGLTGIAVPDQEWPYQRRRAAVLASAPFISVVICTRDRAEQIKKCLSRLTEQTYPNYEVVVVDNAPQTDALRQVVEGAQTASGAAFRYCVEPRPGLSWARNAGIAAARSDIIAFLDDDDEPDPDWLTWIAAGFARGPKVGCVSGIVLPAKLDNAVENLFEEIGGHSKGRGFAAEVFDSSGAQSPLWPLPPFGVGANMAFRREALTAIGGFDTALGAGTPTGGGEDTLAITMVMLTGYEMVYEPVALMWHHHRQDMASLNKQLHGYSIGLTAFYAALLRRRPSSVFGLIKLLPMAVKYLKGGDTAEEEPASQPPAAPQPQGLAAELDRRALQGMLKGPSLYGKSRRLQRRNAAASATTRAQ
jgi:GT2 family glycosyltransferase